MRFRRICARCGEEYIPTGKYNKLCDKCKRSTGHLARRELHPETKRHKVLICTQKHSKAYRREDKEEKV